MELNTSLIDNIDVTGVDGRDYPDFCDAYIDGADYDGVEMTDEQLECLNDDYPDFVYQAVLDSIY